MGLRSLPLGGMDVPAWTPGYLTRLEERACWLHKVWCLDSQIQSLEAASFFGRAAKQYDEALLVSRDWHVHKRCGPAFGAGVSHCTTEDLKSPPDELNSLHRHGPSVGQETDVVVETLEQGWSSWKHTMKPKEAKVVQAAAKPRSTGIGKPLHSVWGSFAASRCADAGFTLQNVCSCRDSQQMSS